MAVNIGATESNKNAREMGFLVNRKIKASVMYLTTEWFHYNYS